MDVLTAHYCKHYIKINDKDEIVDWWSDGSRPDKTTDGAICITDKGGTQFQLVTRDGLTRVNPDMLHFWGMQFTYLYTWDDENKYAIAKSPEQLEAERPAPVAPDNTQERRNDFIDGLMEELDNG